MSRHPNRHVDEVKLAARGRWRDVLTVVGNFNRDDLDGRHHPCPRCQGLDRFRLIDEDLGAVLCNQCFKERNGDGIAAIQWRNDWTFGETVKAVAGYLGINGYSRKPTDIVADVARFKRMPLASFLAFGAKADHRGRLEVARVPMFDQHREHCSDFDLSDVSPEFSKGLSAKGKSAGLFVTTWPEPGNVVLIVEGVKDAAGLHGLGYLTVGLPTCEMAAKFARVFAGCHVVIVPDRDTTGEQSAKVTAARLKGVAASVRIATLPGELKAKDGDGVREVLAMKEGEAMLRQAIGDAVVWQPATKAEAKSNHDDDARLSIRSKEGQTDIANARRLVRMHGDKLRYCHSWRKWLVWDGVRWSIDDAGRAVQLAKSVADSIWQEALHAAGADDALRFAAQSAMERPLHAMLSLAESEPGIPIQPHELDRDPWLLNVLNGTIELQTGQLRPHAREDLLTKLAPIGFDAAADFETWDRFLARIFADDAELIGYVRRLAGYWLTGTIREQVLPIFWGVGANGKTTFLNAVMDVLGSDYSMKAASDFLMTKRSDSHPTDKADLFAKRLVVASETEENRRLAESLVKELTGGEKVRARRMREDFWEFSPTHKLVLCTNHKPIIKGTDHAIWRRLRLVPFSVVIPDDQQDKTLPDKLKAEAAGILNWLLAGCLEWQQHGEQPPKAVSTATQSYRLSQDVLQLFLDECCVESDGIRAKASDLYDAYKAWCEHSGEHPETQRQFGEAMTDHGFERKVSNGTWYICVGLRTERTPDP